MIYQIDIMAVYYRHRTKPHSAGNILGMLPFLYVSNTASTAYDFFSSTSSRNIKCIEGNI